MASNASEGLPRDTPAWVTYVAPLRLVFPDGEGRVAPTLDEVNADDYDHGKLCRIVHVASSGGSRPPVFVCGDGALASPVCREIPDRAAAVTHFSRILCALCLGGIFCEGIDNRDVVVGQLHERRAIWPVNLGQSLASYTRALIRMRCAGPFHSIALVSAATTGVAEIAESLKRGTAILARVRGVDPQFLVAGLSSAYFHNWAAALSNLWIVIEQLTESLWKCHFLTNGGRHPITPIQARLRSLRTDNRTYSAAVRHELMYQVGVLSDQCLSHLGVARGERNQLAHSGRIPSREGCVAAIQAVESLLRAASGEAVELLSMDVDLLGGSWAQDVAVPESASDGWSALP